MVVPDVEISKTVEKYGTQFDHLSKIQTMLDPDSIWILLSSDLLQQQFAAGMQYSKFHDPNGNI